ncbi:MAG: class I SAM-dependent methyltransferase [Bdellovibrionaceae bacterium]|nr:class I SAM-dependent methyltransferase [Pseudobdellovibrionaceae bacterium]
MLIKLTKTQKQKIQKFRLSILEKNKSINLISRKNPQEQWSLLLKQGLLTAQFLKAPLLKLSSSDFSFEKKRNLAKSKKNQKAILDIGSGNGFPGILFAILFPRINFYLCERIRKKAEFLKSLKHELKLFNVKVFCLSAEDIKDNFDLVLSQASLPLEEMIKLLKKILSPQGEAFLWQAENREKKKAFSEIEIKKFKAYEFNKKKKVILKIKKQPNDFEID